MSTKTKIKNYKTIIISENDEFDDDTSQNK
jgi:hypothetical protein